MAQEDEGVAAAADVDDAPTVARQLGSQGIAAYQAQAYDEACYKLEQAYQLLTTPSLGLWSARAHARLGRLVEAAERYRQAASAAVEIGGDATAEKEAQREAIAELNELSCLSHGWFRHGRFPRIAGGARAH